MSDNNDPELYVAIVSLAIALVALLGTVLQVLQQYYASATGFSNCDERVIGDWSQGKRRVFRWSELRFEVQFQTPVIFVCPASNKNRPIQGRDILFVDGSLESQARTMTDPLAKPKIKQLQQQQKTPAPSSTRAISTCLPRFWDECGPITRRGVSTSNTRTENIDSVALDNLKRRIHTADNEKATWVTMLTELQRMEHDSYDWLRRYCKEDELPPLKERELMVALQAKGRSWDNMPSHIKKPYATTTMCHLVEMAAMLGLHWKEFDRFTDKYRAEGNGYLLTGSHVADLGIMFSFQIYANSRFDERRIVPSEMVKAFAFGIVPTLFNKPPSPSAADSKDVDAPMAQFAYPQDNQADMNNLLLGSLDEVAETAASFGCNTHTTEILRSAQKKHGHLFPLAFEIVGMLSKPLYQPGILFRAVPNPTVYTWDRRFFDLRKLLTQFASLLRKTDSAPRGLPADPNDYHLGLLNKVGVVANAFSQPPDASSGVELTLELCKTLFDAIKWCDKSLNTQTDPSRVTVVLREHIQEVLRIVNDEDQVEVSGHAAEDRRHRRQGALAAVEDDATPQIDRLNAAAPEQRHHVLMGIYFDDVLPRVTEQAETSFRRFRTELRPSPRTDAGPPRSASADGRIEQPQPEPLSKMAAREIWFTLVFRMLCWLMLHDFHKNDRQVSSKTEVCGSRLPVYIS